MGLLNTSLRKNLGQLTSEEILRLALTSSRIAVWTLEISTNIVDADEHCPTLFGLAAGDLPETLSAVLSLVHPNDRDRLQHELDAAIQQGIEYSTEFRTANNRSIAMRGKVCATQSEPSHFTAVCWDATHSPQPKQDADSRFQALLEAGPDAVIVVNQKGEIVLANTQLEKLFGFSRHDLLGKKVETLMPERFRDAHSSHRVGFFSDPRTRAMGLRPDLYGLRKDGTEFPVEISLSYIETEQGTLASGAIRDITERRAAEDELRRSRAVLQSLFESLPGLFLILTPELKIVSVSDAYLAATMIKRDEVVGRGIFDVFPDNPDDPSADGVSNLHNSFNRVLLTRAVDRMAIQKYDIRRPDGSFEERYWSPINSAVLGTEGQIEYLIHRVEDVTDFVKQKSQPVSDNSELRSRMEEMETEMFRNSQQLRAANLKLHEANTQLLRAKAEAEAGNKAKSAFLSTVSHEIRTPMNAILGYAQLMLRDPALAKEAEENLKIIDRSGEHLLALINDVLDMSKIEAGRTELNVVTFNLSRMLADLAAMFRLRSEAKMLIFDMHLDGEPAPWIVADEAKVRQIFINLLGNAVKFTRLGQIAVHVTLQQKQEDLWLSARVEDTGLGIADEDQKKLFEPFSQIRSNPDTLQGTGLGLAISRKYARLMGGDITVTSNPGSGSVFHLQIPIKRGESSVVPEQIAPGRVSRISDPTKTPRILVVDDLLENRDWLIKLLATIGFSVQGAENGEQAIRCWREWNPQLILMDVNMPVMDGLAATRRIKTDPRGKGTSIVVLTASVMEEDRRIIFQSGADDFLAKPCRQDVLLEKIRTFLNISYDYEETNANKVSQSLQALSSAPPEMPAPAGGNIMIVDDDHTNLRLLGDMLRLRGHHVRPFDRGARAFADALKHPPDLILLDITMPEMNGYEFCERLKCAASVSEIPVIFLSAMNETEDKLKAFRSGAVDYISKPFQFEEVYARVETHLNVRKLQLALELQNENLEKAVAARTSELAEANQRLASSEERLRLALQSAAIGTWEENPLRGELHWDTRSKAIFGFPPEFKPEMTAVWSCIHPEDREAVQQAVQSLHDPAGTGRFQMEYRIHAAADGALRYVHGQGKAFFEGEREVRRPVRSVGTLQDITERKIAEAEVKRSLHEKEALLQEVHHRVKNNLQIISSLLSMQASEIHDREVVAKLADSERRVKSMALIHEHLYGNDDMSSIDMADYVRDLAGELFSCYARNPLVTPRLDLAPAKLAIDQAIPCGLILNELITNALKYAYPAGEGEIAIRIGAEEQKFRLTVSDQGVGLPTHFNSETSKSLGMTLIEVLTNQLDGELEIGPPPGASFTVRFPHLSATLPRKTR
jgi:PAS domain S-box-containing protein